MAFRGNSLVTVDKEGTIHTWDAATGEFQSEATPKYTSGRKHRFDDEGGIITSIALTPDGRRLVVGWGGEMHAVVCAFDTASGSEVATRIIAGGLFAADSNTYAVTISADDSLFLVGDHSGNVTMLKAAQEGTELAEPSRWALSRDPLGETRGVAFSPDGRRALSCGISGLIHVFDVAGRSEIMTFSGPVGGTLDASFSPDGQHVAVAGANGTVQVWNVNSKRLVRDLSGHKGEVSFARFVSGDRLVSLGYHDAVMLIWALDTDALQCTNLIPLSGMTPAVSPDGKILLTADDTKLSWYDIGTARCTHTAIFDTLDTTLALAWTVSGARIVSRSEDDDIAIRDASAPETICAVVKSTLEYSPNGAALSMAGGDLVVWDGPDVEVRSLGDSTSMIQLNPLLEGEQRSDRRFHVSSAAFSSTGDELAIGRIDGSIIIFERPFGGHAARCVGHRGPAFVGFAQHYVVSVGIDGTVRMWSPKTGVELRCLELGLGRLRSVWPVSDGNLWIIRTEDGIAQLDLAWPTRRSEPVVVRAAKPR
jgi:WD40 repeat protein